MKKDLKGTQKQTQGQYIVGVDFNPSGNKDVHNVKMRTAAIIDDLIAIRDNPSTPSEGKRCAAIAMTNFETACMYAVKAITKPEMK